MMVAIPPAALASAHLAPDSLVDISVDESTGVVSLKPSRRRYTLDELLSQCEAEAGLSDEERAWLEDAPRGRETL